MAGGSGTLPRSWRLHSAWRTQGSAIRGIDGNETEIISRCTDEIGQVQPTRENRQVLERSDRDYRMPGLDNSVMPWRIARDGSVTNGLA